MSTPEPALPAQTDPLPAGRYDIDPTRCTVAFRAKAFGLLWVHGTVPVAHGHLQVDDTTVRGSGELAADGIDTGVGVRDWHLRSNHYLRTAEHPRIQVELDALDPTDPEPTCTVTVRGHPHPVAMTMHRLELEDGTLRVRSSTDLDRTAFPMLPPVAGVSRVVHLDVDLAAVPA